MKPDPLTENDQLVAAIIARHGNVVVDLLNYVKQADASQPSPFKKKSPLLDLNQIHTAACAEPSAKRTTAAARQPRRQLPEQQNEQ